MPSWIDFKELRAKLRFEQLLRYYQVEVRRKGEQHQGFCPLPSHRAKNASPSFSANLELGIFQCFGCGAKGNALDFAILMENVNPNDGRAVRKVALKLRRELLSDVMPVTSKPPSAKDTRPPVAAKASKIVVNAPLDFELKDLESDHLCLLETGLTGSTIARFGLGLCSRGRLKDRIAIPLHDREGNLVGYAGWLVDDSKANEANPTFLLPSTRERNGTIFEFDRALFLYNGHRMEAAGDDLIIVQDFPSVWWLTQHGFPWSVALMGSDCSEEQAELIVVLVKPSGRVWIMPDGDGAGERLAQSLLLRLSPHRFVRWVKLGSERQPTDLPAQTLKTNFTL